MSNNKESSVEWYDNEIGKLFNKFIVDKITIYEFRTEQLELKTKAKAMHKEEIKNAFTNGFISHLGSNRIADEIYYNETFGGNNEQQ